MKSLWNLKITSVTKQKKKNDASSSAQTPHCPERTHRERSQSSRPRGHRLTTEGDDVAAVFVDKFPRDGLLHDLLHLEGKAAGEGTPMQLEGHSDNYFPCTPSSLRLL